MSLLERVRQETQPIHRRLERALPLLAAENKGVAYRHYLIALWGFYGPIESRLGSHFASPAAQLNFEERRKSALLESDLRALGLSQTSIEELPRSSALPDASDLPRATGCLYVLEGATLGGRVLLRQLRAELPSLDETRGLSFLAGYGNATAAQWRSFCEYLSRWAGVTGAEDAVIDGAVETFLCLESWLSSETRRARDG